MLFKYEYIKEKRHIPLHPTEQHHLFIPIPGHRRGHARAAGQGGRVDAGAVVGAVYGDG